MRLNLGCGHVQPEHWVNVDGSNRAWLASHLPRIDRALVRAGLLQETDFTSRTVWANLLKSFTWADASVDAIYMGEILEHFTKSEGEHVLRECRRILKPGGRIRIRVPNHSEFWRQYLRDYDVIRASPRSDWSVSHSRWTQMYFDTVCVTRPRPWQSMGHFHKWMYDDVTLILALETAGFRDVEPRCFHDSDIPGIEAVEMRADLIVEAAA